MKSDLLKYKIGLIVIALFMVGLVGYVLMQASATKQDTKTNSAASSIADKLNSYISDNQSIPDTLAQAGAQNVPAIVSYQKLSASSYKFCVTYKSNSSGFDATGAVVDLATGSAAADTGNSNFTDNTELFIDTTYHKGANCQTIKPILAQTQPAQCSSATSTSICVPSNASGSSSAGSNTSTSAIKLCGYGFTQEKGCVVRCTQSTQSTALNKSDDTISDITTAGKNTTIDAIDTKGATRVVTITSDTKIYNSTCATIPVSSLLVDDQIRVIVAGQTVPATQGTHVTASEVDDFSD